MRAPVYIAAPFNAVDREHVRWNVQRAVLLADLALHEGKSPVLTHSTGFMLNRPETPALRAAVLAWGIDLLDLVARHSSGELWILDPASRGMHREQRRWGKHHLGSRGVRRADWAGWEQAVRTTGDPVLLMRYHHLAEFTGETADPVV